jgi:hypothetical protein
MLSFAIWEAWRWRRDRDAQCAAAEPLVAARAGLDELRGLRPGRPPGEHSGHDVSQLIREFGASAEESESIRRNLHANGRVLEFSESNSVMLIYVDQQSRAARAECFLQ